MERKDITVQIAFFYIHEHTTSGSIYPTEHIMTSYACSKPNQATVNSDSIYLFIYSLCNNNMSVYVRAASIMYVETIQ